MDVFYRKVKILLSFQEQIDFRKSCDIMFLSETKGMINASNIQRRSWRGACGGLAFRSAGILKGDSIR